MKLIFVTTNEQKFAKGKAVCHEYGIELIQRKLDIDEVQSEDTDYVARRKAEAAYEIVKAPVIISDDAWGFHGLNGFPGTYAKSVNTWLTADDYIRLMEGVSNRKVSFVQTLVFEDETGQKLFKNESIGTTLEVPRGDSGVSIQAVVSLEPDGKASIAEMINGGSHYDGPAAISVWHEFAKWYAKQVSNR